MPASRDHDFVRDPELFRSVKGFLDEAEGRCLYVTALRASRNGPCLEIGGYCGKSAICLGAACRETGGVLFSIDHHRGSEEQQPGEAYFDPDLVDVRTLEIDSLPFFRDTLRRAGLLETVVPIVCDSTTAARAWATPLSLVFIDGGHSFESALNDYLAWRPHILPGGYLLFHDIFPNPTAGGQAPYRVYTRARKSGLFRELPMVGTVGILQRTG